MNSHAGYTNNLTLLGIARTMPTIDYKSFGETFYRFELAVPRKSGAEDILPVMVPGRALDRISMTLGTSLYLEGQVRTENKVVDGKNRLLVSAFVRHIELCSSSKTINDVELCGTICKAPTYRFTPRGREISDFILAVNRSVGSDYIPCIAWRGDAQLAKRLSTGDKVWLKGRMQSRGYQKVMPDGNAEDRVAYEVSIGAMEYTGMMVKEA